jgi:hypothetical protein
MDVHHMAHVDDLHSMSFSVGRATSCPGGSGIFLAASRGRVLVKADARQDAGLQSGGSTNTVSFARLVASMKSQP